MFWYSPEIESDTSGRIVRLSYPRGSNFHAHVRWKLMNDTVSFIDAVAPEVMRHVKYLLVMPNAGPGEGNLIRSILDAKKVE